jgi:hypothetical protein
VRALLEHLTPTVRACKYVTSPPLECATFWTNLTRDCPFHANSPPLSTLISFSGGAFLLLWRRRLPPQSGTFWRQNGNLECISCSSKQRKQERASERASVPHWICEGVKTGFPARGSAGHVSCFKTFGFLGTIYDSKC